MGHKYELVSWSPSNDAVNLYRWRLFINIGGVHEFVDFVDVAAPPYVILRPAYSLVINAGESLEVFPTSAGVAVRTCQFTYVDVSPV